MTYWTLEYDGTEKTLEDWGIDDHSVERTLRSQTIGTLKFLISGDGLADLPFAYGAEIIIYRDRTGIGPFSGGSIWWTGIVTKPGWAASDSEESIPIGCSDPWFFLEDQNMVYEQAFKVFSAWVDDIPGGTPIFIDDSTSHITLNQDIDGGIWGTRAQLEDILDWAISQGAPIDYDAGTFPDMKIPLRTERDITCAEAIRLQLAYMDAVTWFDFSTTPPKLRIARRSALTPVSIATTALDMVEINPRYDLQVNFVKLKFEKEFIDSGGTYAAPPIIDSWPDPLPAQKYGGLVGTIVLAPWQSSSLKQYLTCATLDPSTTAFWKSVKPEMDEALHPEAADLYFGLTVLSYDVLDAQTGDPVTLPRYAVDPQIADWMGITATLVNVSAQVSYTTKHKLASGDKVDVVKSRTQTLNAQLLATDGTTGWYQSNTILDPGEDPSEFAGLAHNIYNDLNVLNYDGQIAFTESELSGSIGMGNTVNVTGGNSAWATMASAVQSITENIGTGNTRISLGVNEHLSPGKLVDLLRINRTRNYVRYSARSTGEYGGHFVATLPSLNARRTLTDAPEILSEQSVSSETSGALTQVQLKASTADAAEIKLHSTTTAGIIDSAKGRISISQADVARIAAKN